MCPGSEASIVVAVKQLERYPVDLYYLVDVSASMQENLDHVGVALSVPLSESVVKYFTCFSLKEREYFQGLNQTFFTQASRLFLT